MNIDDLNETKEDIESVDQKHKVTIIFERTVWTTETDEEKIAQIAEDDLFNQFQSDEPPTADETEVNKC